jgi:aromatic ring-opening dioxygenase catalytic subunit (LigB family)
MPIATPHRLPTLYIPHGGGPCFFMEPMAGLPADTWDRMAAYLRGIATTLPHIPRQILVVSAHWEAPVPTVGDAPRHHLLYDYYGFPEHTYHLAYPASGAPALAARVRALLQAADIASATDTQRGLDHGVFIPFKLIYPDAAIPIVPLSLVEGLDAATHVAIGRALAPLRDEGVLIVGSGMSYHNLRSLMRPDAAASEAARQFHDWLAATLATAGAGARDAALARWQAAPGAIACHPRSEHLLPLMVAAGAAMDDAATLPYREKLLGKDICAVQFG